MDEYSERLVNPRLSLTRNQSGGEYGVSLSTILENINECIKECRENTLFYREADVFDSLEEIAATKYAKVLFSSSCKKT